MASDPRCKPEELILANGYQDKIETPGKSGPAVFAFTMPIASLRDFTKAIWLRQ
jgi:hypothetical protein